MRVFSIVLVLVVLLATAAAALAATRPALRVVDRQPAVVRGTGFAAGERVKVVAATARGALVRRLTASQTGAFTVRFEGAPIGCPGIRTVTATGNRSGAVRIRPVTRICPPPAE